VQRTLLNTFRFRKEGGVGGYGTFRKHPEGKYPIRKYPTENTPLSYNEKFLKDELVINLRARALAIAIFLYYFIENGTLGLVPQKLYFVYRNVRISDLILYGLVLYSFISIREYKDLFKSRSLLITKAILIYFLFEFAISALRYDFNVIEYFFRLKGLWSSFLIFPYLLLLKRNGVTFLIKIFFPVAVISNILYILSALTGIPFLPDVSIIKQRLPGDIEVFRVYGGTFYGDLFYLGFIYYWITNKFKFWQLILAVIFIIPHILAFGRLAWAGFIFTIFLMLVLNSLKKKQFKVIFKQAAVIVLLTVALLTAFIKFIPESDFYFDALQARLFQGEEDVKYSEGTYGTRVITQNDVLLNLWSKSDIFLGIGMHPMWVVRPESHEENLCYGAFCDVGWPGVLAAYGLIGFILALILQVYYAFLSFKIIKRSSDGVYTFLITLMLAKLLFDSLVNFSFIFLSTGLWGMFMLMNFYIPVMVHSYEKLKKEGKL
jgi:hypothetical protein